MFVFKGIILILGLLHVIVHSGDVRRPPSITKNPVEIKDFRSGETVQLDCSATGHPTPEFTWYHNSYEIRAPGPSGNIQMLSPGVLQLSQVTAGDEGHYHCMASNQYGSVFSNSSYLRHGKISEGIQGVTIPTNYTALEWSPYRLDCFKATSVPPPIYGWCLTEYTPNDQYTYSASQQCLTEDKRIQIDDEGALHFMYVQKSDSRNGLVYKCNAHNTAVDLTKGGGYARLTIKEQPNVGHVAPSLLFSSGNLVVVLEGHELTLRCFFSGYPIGTMAWSRTVEGVTTTMPSGRTQYSNNGYTIKIARSEPSDAGIYRCTMTNSVNSSHHDIAVEVHARPTMKSNLHRPLDQNITEGESAVFNCTPHAVPTPKLTWYRNMEPLNGDNLPSRMSITPDKTRLLVRDVRRDTVDLGGIQEVTDLGVIQCLVENKHGKFFYSGFLNVLKKTEMTRKPSPHTVNVVDGNARSVIFTCDASTDDSTPLSLKWYFDPTGGEEIFESVYSYPEKILLNDGNRSLEIKVRNSSEWVNHGGQYKCIADNGYSRVEAVADLTVELPATAAPLPAEEEVREASPLWWILLLVILICLVLLSILLCCYCCYRNRGKEYKVDKNERKSGNDPVKELNTTAFADYQRPSSDPLRGSRASLGSSIKMDSDDEGSLNEYGDIDAGKFGEDGSFIGDYNTESRRNHGYQRV